MSKQGTIATGAPTVLIGGKEAARKGDIVDHGGLIAEGCPTVVIGGAALCAARIGHRFRCPDVDMSPLPSPHVGGIILLPGFPEVLIGGLPAARKGDATLCLGPASTLGGDGDGDGGGSAGGDSECAKLWKKYQDEAKDIIKPAGDDHRRRNKIISGAYADLYLHDRSLVWAGLGGYASKQVGCAMDHAQNVSEAATPNGGGVRSPMAKVMADYTYEKLGEGNRDLFLDIYPVHRFFQEQGYAKMAKCAAERVPPLPAQLLDGFRALDQYKKTGDPKDLSQHLTSIAQHEQINILQSGVYNDWKMQKILRANEGVGGHYTPLQMPAASVLGTECTPGAGDLYSRFNNGKRSDLYSVPQRMDWILNDIGKPYMNNVQGTPKMNNDMEAIRRQGALAGGRYT